MNKRRFAAFAATALVLVGLLFGQGPVQKVRLWDTNLSHSLLLNWNEDRTAGYTLNWIGITADRTITLQGNPTLDDWFDQSVKTTFSPTFVTVKLSVLTDGYFPYHVADATGLANSVIRTDGTLVGVGMLPTVAQLEVNTSQIITSTTAAPYLKLVNLSDTARDPIHQMAVGATPVVKWTWGLDDSDADKWKLANTAALGTVMSDNLVFGDILYYTHGDNDIVGVELSDFETDAIYIAGGVGSGDGNFNSPCQIAYDGTYIYVADDLNYRIQKFLQSDGSFVAKHVFSGTGRPWGICYWDGKLYVTLYAGTPAHKVEVLDALTLTEIDEFGSWGTSGDDKFNGPRSLTTDGTHLYICDTNNDRIKKHTLAGVFVDKVGSNGTGNGQFDIPLGIATDATHIYVCDYLNNRVQKFLCSTLAYVSHVDLPDRAGSGPGAPSSITLNGVYWYVGVNDDAPYNGYHIKYDIATDTFQDYYDCSVGSGGSPDTIWGSIILKDKISHGDLIVVHETGAFVDIYPQTRFFDYIRLYEGALETGEYAGLRASSAVAASYYLTLPSAVNTVKNHLYAAEGGFLHFGQNVDTDGAPSFDHLHLTVATGTAPLVVTSTTVVANLNVSALGGHAASYFEPALGNPGTNGWVLSSTTLGVRSWVAQSGGVASFVDLDDVPANYAGAGGKVVKVNAGATGLEFVAGGAGVASFNDLDDVPASYVGQGGLFAKVKATEDGLEYAAGGAGAPDNAKYIVGLANATLSAERVKQALYNNYDLDDTPGSPNALDDEFDDSSLDGKWTITNAPGVRNWDETTYVGFLSAVILETATTDDFAHWHRIYQVPPVTGNFAMEFIAKVCLDIVYDLAFSIEIGEWADLQLYLGESTHSKWVASGLQTNDASPSSVNLRQQGMGIHDNGSGLSTFMTNHQELTGISARWVYLKLKKETTAAYTSANTYSAWVSLNGLAWQLVGSCSHTFDHDCNEVGIMCRPPKAQGGTPTSGPFVDFFRRTI